MHTKSHISAFYLHCKLHSTAITLHMRLSLKSQYLFVVGAMPFPTNQNVKYEWFYCPFQIFHIFGGNVYRGFIILTWFNTSPPSAAYICVGELGKHWLRKWLVAYSAPSHYLNQCWVFFNWTLRNKIRWIFIQNTKRKCIWKCRLWNGGHLSRGDELTLIPACISNYILYNEFAYPFSNANGCTILKFGNG